MLKKLAIALALSSAATSAQAATMLFVPDDYGVGGSETLFTDFNDAGTAPIASGSGYLFLTGSSGSGAQPNPGDGTQYLSILGGGTAEIDLGQAAAFGIDIGSLDTYNTLTVLFANGDEWEVTGSMIAGAVPNGSQSGSGANGRLTVTAGAGEVISGIRLTSSSNSFEVDNLATTAVPEPSAWALMLAGFGLVGTGLRSRRRQVAAQIA